jgi:hypothetical protein
MNFYKGIIGFCICLCSVNAIAQSNKPETKTYRYSIYGGVGPNIYFNNLVIGADYVNELNYSFSGKLMWEPEHLLSLGIESGYIRLYTLDFGDQSSATIVNSAIPIHLVVTMKILKTYYFSFASGQTILLNDVSTEKNGEINASVLSLGDLSGSIGYKRQIKERISIGAETKFFYSSKLDDKNIALLFMAGFSF